MSKSSIRASLMALMLALPISTQPAAAQDSDDWWPSWSGRMHQMMSGECGPGQMREWQGDGMLDRMEGRLAYMKTELKITPEQATNWETFATVMKSSAEIHNDMMREMRDELSGGKLLEKPLPERLARQIDHMEKRLEQMKTVKTATDKLYTYLSDEQKKEADDIVLPMIGMGMGRHMMRW